MFEKNEDYYIQGFVLWFHDSLWEEPEYWTVETLEIFINTDVNACAIWDMFDNWAWQSDFDGVERDKAYAVLDDWKLYVKRLCDKECRDRLYSMGVID